MPQPHAFPSLGRSAVDRLKVRRLLASPDVFTTTLMVLVLDEFGMEALQWAPTVLRMELEQEYLIQLPPLTVDRLATGNLLLTSDDVFHSLPKFIAAANVLAGTPIDEDLLDLADAEECAWAATEIALLRPDAPTDGYSEEIAGYIQAVVAEEGLLRPPGLLKGFFPDGGVSWDGAGDFSDDPEMFQAVSENQSSQVDDLDQSLQATLRELFDELKSLPLLHGDSKGVGRYLESLLQQTPKKS